MGEPAVLRFAEEMLLLLLDDENGTFAHVPSWSLNYALGGAVLMDLALENRIDTDLEKLFLVDETPLGDSLVDPMLGEIAGDGKTHDARFWVERAAGRAAEIRETALDRLVNAGILARHDERFLWVFRSRRYPVVDGTAEREVKLRIMEVLFGQEIPDPRDVMLICLVDGCGIFSELLSKHELSNAADRIAQVRQMDLIGQATSQAIRDIELSIAVSVQPHMY